MNLSAQIDDIEVLINEPLQAELAEVSQDMWAVGPSLAMRGLPYSGQLHYTAR